MFLLPIRDDNPHTIKPWVNYGLILSCILVFLWQNSLGEQGGEIAIFRWALIPGSLIGRVTIDPRVERAPEIFTLFSHMFMHGGWIHLIGNMWFLFIFGDNVEASLGHKRYLIFYLVCGLCAAAGQFSLSPGSDIPMIGASGAIAGVLGAYMLLHPRSNIAVLIFFIVVNLPAWIVLGFYFIGQVMSQQASSPDQPGVAFMAHIAGFVAGAVLVFAFRKPQVPVLQPPHTRPFSVERARGLGARRRYIPDYEPRQRGPWD